ncbi:hypothetical protein M9H77_34710 [Catharanthus roseus]|uniref:Uncharacterized protein n=1 Tax=Catharanthus roseus TaxID=4058 RepID=A0ACB9ZMP6_CATRO|nr:hypothetical protein M9H77_34710 [Catharanthus roseus]
MESSVVWKLSARMVLATIDYEMPELGPDELVMLWDSDFVRGARLLHYILTQDGQKHNKLLNVVPRGMQIPYSAAVDLVAGLGVSQVVSEPFCICIYCVGITPQGRLVNIKMEFSECGF